ncbi:hypothetical protein LR48_Vigan226s001300 [Vigna angularis]|uniref:Uncharacterized protein n=1 Tax=Phaseolus angularis TaxID=3914 RepID=A0A0L9T7K3_PHAAN|nr:hypothetical protein LR48_Vigan226s001300 [Vigna angularis]
MKELNLGRLGVVPIWDASRLPTFKSPHLVTELGQPVQPFLGRHGARAASGVLLRSSLSEIAQAFYVWRSSAPKGALGRSATLPALKPSKGRPSFVLLALKRPKRGARAAHEVGVVGVEEVGVLADDGDGAGDVGASLVGVEGDRSPLVKMHEERIDTFQNKKNDVT